MWKKLAKYLETVYGAYVNWEERFYICPECGDPVYERDWTENEYCDYLCPICEWTEGKEKEEEEGEEKEFEVIISVAYAVSARNTEQAKEFASEMFMNNINCSNFDVDVVE